MKWLKSFVFFIQLCLFASLNYAETFSVVPVGKLPSGYPATVTYDVMNTSGRTLEKNFVKWLPPNVQLNTSNSTCTPTISSFNLTPQQSCTFSVTVVGPVSYSNDPNKHLMVCASDRVSCTGPIPSNSIVVNTTLQSINITPTNTTIPAGFKKQFQAIAHYSDGAVVDVTSLVNWSSTTIGTATIDSTGLATGINTGVTTITASYSGITSNQATLTVSNAQLNAIDVFPKRTTIAAGFKKQFQAIAHYSDGFSEDITTLAQWSSSDANVASINANTGLATGKNAGSTTITATFQGVTSNPGATLTVTAAILKSISITPTNSSVPVGVKKQFQAVSHYSDGSSQIVTTTVDWHSSQSTVAKIDSLGSATGLRTGTTVITATLNGVTSNTATLAVTAATLTSISITPTTASTPVGLTQQYQAMGSYSDSSVINITTSVTWKSTNHSVATIDTLGLAKAVSTGSANITATLDGKTSNTATLTVISATLTSISVTPATKSLPIGETQQYVATGTYSDSTIRTITSQVTWSSSNSNVASISSTGLAYGKTLGGPLTITASLSGINGTASLTVTPATVTSVTVLPATASITNGGTQQYGATATYSDATQKDVTLFATWSSSNVIVAEVSESGLATGLSGGTTNIVATYKGVSNTTPSVLTVTSNFVYVADSYPSTTISSCVVNGDGSLGACSTSSSPPGAHIEYNGLAITPTANYLYVTDSNNSAVYYCPINNDGSVGACNTTGSGFSTPHGAAVNPSSGAYAYFANLIYGSGNAVIYCPITGNGSLGTCNPTGNGLATPAAGIVINPTGTYAYVTNNSFSTASNISFCTVNSDGTFSNCNPTVVSGNNTASGLAINPKAPYLYFTDWSTSRVFYCPINDDGSLGNCTPTGDANFSIPNYLAINSAGTFIYITNYGSATVVYCQINSDATLSNCNSTGSGFSNVQGIAIS